MTKHKVRSLAAIFVLSGKKEPINLLPFMYKNVTKQGNNY